MRPATAHVAVRLTAAAAAPSPNTGARRVTRWVISPTCANSASAKAAERVMNRRSRSSAPSRSGGCCGWGLPAAEETSSPSGSSPRVVGVGPSKLPANGQSMASMTAPTSAAAAPTPSVLINAAHSGVKTTPPMLAPLSAWLSAAGRRRSNHGDTMALIAAPLVAAHPAPVAAAATNSCHGAKAKPQPHSPNAVASTPKRVTAAIPNRRCASARHATMAAPTRKCVVIAAAMVATGQPRSW